MSWWQECCRSGPPTGELAYRAASAFAGWRGLLARPHARDATRARGVRVGAPYWTGHWAAYAGGDAVADQVGSREWTALREYATAWGSG